MCGFSGFFSPGRDELAAYSILRSMGSAILHRGPDSGGEWFDSSVGVGFSHRRLAVVDLSPAGHQPMFSANRQLILVFNGEIYNHAKIRGELDRDVSSKIEWQGHSDTETLLAGFVHWGVEQTLNKAEGMFAFALWNRESESLVLGRDRLGEKPLYYGWHGSTFLFGSELRALKVDPAFEKEIDRNALCLFLRHNYVPSPYSIYRGISKLEPGCIATIDLNSKQIAKHKYWSASKAALHGAANPFSGTAKEAVDRLQQLASSAIEQQMIADVPLGAFLSGGIDSSTVVALMQAHSDRPVRTFSIGFHEKGFNEANYAKEVANYLGTDHTELYLQPEQAQAIVPSLVNVYDEPFADSSQIPTYLVSEMAREHVTVSLSGDGGDELFCGYVRYELAERVWRALTKLPLCTRKLAANVADAIPQRALDKVTGFGPVASRVSNFGDKMKKATGVVSSTSADDLYYGLVSYHRSPTDLVIGGEEKPTNLTGLKPNLESLSYTERMMALDAISYLPDDILTKVDRAAMAVSLETRVPFLDHRIYEYSWSLPLECKLRNGETKWPLRQLLARYVPRNLFERPKMGFGVPLGDWLRGPLLTWADKLLDAKRLELEGFFRPEPVRRLWEEHRSGKQDRAAWLWSILMFQAWLELELSES